MFFTFADLQKQIVALQKQKTIMFFTFADLQKHIVN
jgi:hypothetical protein